MKGAIILALVACSAAVQPRAHYERLDPKLEFPKIHGQYIVVLESIAEHSLGVQNHFAAVGGEVKYNYHISNANDVAKDFLGYHIIVKDGDTAVLEYIKSRVGKEVKYIEQDSTVRASESCDTQHSATWGIVRTVNRDNSNDGEYTYNEEHTGEDVVAYIIDTGIATDNEDFEDRAIWGADFATNPSPGTHCCCLSILRTVYCSSF
jgi:subtilisin family serine protease